MKAILKFSLIPLLLHALTSQAAVTVTSISAGFGYSLFLKSDGSLWAMGYNFRNELGDGTSNNTNRPEQIVAAGVTAISAAWFHSVFVKSDCSISGVGYNEDGDLGDGTHATSAPNVTNHPEQIVADGVTAIAAGGSHSLFLKPDGSLWAMGGNQWGQLGNGTVNNTNRPEQIVAGCATAIAAVGNHTFLF